MGQKDGGNGKTDHGYGVCRKMVLVVHCRKVRLRPDTGIIVI